MSEYVIGACSCCDLPSDYAAQRNLIVLPYHYFMDGNEYIENQGDEAAIKFFYTKLREGSVSTTSMVNTETFESLFRPVLESGRDMLYIVLSSGLSGSYNNAKMVAEKLSKEFPQRKLYVVDSLSAARGFGLFVHLILNQRDEGKSIDEVYNWALENTKHLIHWFAVDSLDHLRRGGRVSRATAFLGTMMNIKPVLRFDNDGKIIPVEKIRGRKKSLIELVDKMDGQFENPKGATVFIGHGDALEDAQFLEKLVWERYPQIKETFIHYIGPIVGTHSGPSTIALHYLGNQR
ncbi:MAG: DegV family protein [Eubacteriales bacterium]